MDCSQDMRNHPRIPQSSNHIEMAIPVFSDFFSPPEDFRDSWTFIGNTILPMFSVSSSLDGEPTRSSYTSNCDAIYLPP